MWVNARKYRLTPTQPATPADRMNEIGCAFRLLARPCGNRRRPIEKKFPLRLDWRPPVKHLTRILSFLLFAAAMSCVTAQAQTCADWLKVKGWKGNYSLSGVASQHSFLFTWPVCPPVTTYSSPKA